MKGFKAALWAETLKIRRSKLLWISIIVTLFFALVMGFFMFVLKNPAIAREYGLVGAKATLIGKADWPSLFMLLNRLSMVGMIGFGFLASWCFGREYADRTFKDLLALPVSRSAIITGKFIVLGAWCLVIAVLLYALGLLAGCIVGLDGWDSQVFYNATGSYALSITLILLLVTTVAFVASWSRGYLPPLAFMILTMLLAQVVMILGYGPYFPWAIPILASGEGGPDAAPVGFISYTILFITTAAGLAGTYAWWRFADQA
jgi:ABC-2 type transport system permease protein